jgi:hypothetical protein
MATGGGFSPAAAKAAFGTTFHWPSGLWSRKTCSRPGFTTRSGFSSGSVALPIMSGSRMHIVRCDSVESGLIGTTESSFHRDGRHFSWCRLAEAHDTMSSTLSAGRRPANGRLQLWQSSAHRLASTLSSAPPSCARTSCPTTTSSRTAM